MNDRLYRSPTDRVIAGVAGGMAVWLNVDPSFIRIAWVLLAIFSGGIFILVYIVMMIVVPLPPPGWVPRRSAGTPGGGGQGWGAGWDQTGWSSGTGAPGSPPAQGSAPAAGSPGSPPAPGSPPTPPAGGGWSTPPPPAPGWSSQNAGVLVGVVLIGLGAWFLVARYVRIDWALLWPAVVIVLGIGLIVAALRRGQSGGG